MATNRRTDNSLNQPVQRSFAYGPPGEGVAPRIAGSRNHPPGTLNLAESWHVVETTDQTLIDEICRFRVRVWREEGQLDSRAFAGGAWRDQVDDHALHWLIRDSHRRSAAAGRLHMCESLDDVHQAEEYLRFGLKLPGPVAAPDRVVVARHARGNGLGRQILDLQDTAAEARGALHAVRQASPRMVQLLKHRGWRVLGPASPDDRFPGVDFQVVVKEF